MCGRLNFIDDLFMRTLMHDLSIEDAWLDKDNHQTDMFTELLKPALRHDFLVQEIQKPSCYNKIGEAVLLRPNDNFININ